MQESPHTNCLNGGCEALSPWRYGEGVMDQQKPAIGLHEDNWDWRKAVRRNDGSVRQKSAYFAAIAG